MKKSVVVLVIIAFIGLVIYSQRAPIAQRIMAKGLEARMSAGVISALEDGLHLGP